MTRLIIQVFSSIFFFESSSLKSKTYDNAILLATEKLSIQTLIIIVFKLVVVTLHSSMFSNILFNSL